MMDTILVLSGVGERMADFRRSFLHARVFSRAARNSRPCRFLALFQGNSRAIFRASARYLGVLIALRSVRLTMGWRTLAATKGVAFKGGRLRVTLRYAFIRGILASRVVTLLRFLNVRVTRLHILRFLRYLQGSLLVNFVSRIYGGTALFHPRRVSHATGIRVLRNSISSQARIARILCNLRASTHLEYRCYRQQDGRVTRDLFVATSRATARLVRITRSRILYSVSSSNVNVKCVSATFGSYDKGRRVVVMIRGARSCLFRFFEHRASVPRAGANVKCVLIGRDLRVGRVKGAIICGRRLSVTARLGIRNVNCRFNVRYVCLYLRKVTVKEQYLGSEGIAHSRRKRLRDTQSEDNDRYRNVCVSLRLPGFLFNERPRLLLLVSCRGSRVLRLRYFPGRFVNTSGSVRLPVNRILRSFLNLNNATYATWVVRPCERSFRAK